MDIITPSADEKRQVFLEKERIRNRARYQANKEAKLAQNRRWSEANKEKHRELQRRWYQENKARLNPGRAEYNRQRQKDPVIAEHNRNWQKEYLRKQRAENPGYSVVHRLRVRLNHAIAGNSGTTKSAPTMQLVGCSREFLVAHLESQFLPGMSWENRSEWHIDHIRPCASFDMTDPEQQRACFHWSNLQPLWGKDNLEKQDSVPELVQPGLLLTMA